MARTTPTGETFTAVDPLLAFVGLTRADCPYELGDGGELPLRVPAALAARIAEGDWFDPVLLQVLPRAEELRAVEGFGSDPVGDRAATVLPGLVHKYHDRVLLLTTGACAMHCRYCFRRQRTSRGLSSERAAIEAVCRYLRAHPEVKEIVLSGGDPLALDTDSLHALVTPLLGVDSLETVRIHTRMPIAAPERVTARVCAQMSDIARRRSCVVVVHVNCANEIGPQSREVFARVRAAGALLLSQSVLLKGINDSLERLESLCRALVGCGVVPYYLHQLDRVRGAAHFEVSSEEGLSLVRRLRERLAGYMVPRYVQETPGGACKEVLG